LARAANDAPPPLAIKTFSTFDRRRTRSAKLCPLDEALQKTDVASDHSSFQRSAFRIASTHVITDVLDISQHRPRYLFLIGKIIPNRRVEKISNLR
jgi:hypothetical protein